jgi:hypothetical protein
MSRRRAGAISSRNRTFSSASGAISESAAPWLGSSAGVIFDGIFRTAYQKRPDAMLEVNGTVDFADGAVLMEDAGKELPVIEAYESSPG